MKALLLSLLLLGGCCETRTIYVDRDVEVPVVIMEECPPMPIVPDMQFATDRLNMDSSNPDIARAYVKTVETCKIKVEQYKEALEVSND